MRTLPELAIYASYESIYGTKSQFSDLVESVRVFSQESVLWLCSYFTTGMQLWSKIRLQPEDRYELFIRDLFDSPVGNKLLAGFMGGDPRMYLFHRRQLLLLAKLAVLHCPRGGHDARRHLRDFGRILLQANDHFHFDLLPPSFPTCPNSKDDFARIVAEMLVVTENACPDIGNILARNHVMLRRYNTKLRSHHDFIDVYGKFEDHTGLTLENFEAVILAISAKHWRDDARWLLTAPGDLVLRETDFDKTSISGESISKTIDSLSGWPSRMAHEASAGDKGTNDLTMFRKCPIVRQWYDLPLLSARLGFLVMDHLFLVDKFLGAPYWHANTIDANRLRRFWGAIFEEYVNEILTIAGAGSNAIFLANPRVSSNSAVELCDGLIVSREALVLMEYKSSMFTAEAKYSGDATALAREIERKFVGEESRQQKGVRQLANAARSIFVDKIAVNGVDLSRIKRVYLLLITLDSIGGTIGFCPFLNLCVDAHLSREVRQIVEVLPLFCLDIATLESISPSLRHISLSDILSGWHRDSPSLFMPLSATRTGSSAFRRNEWLMGQWKTVYDATMEILFPGKMGQASGAEV